MTTLFKISKIAFICLGILIVFIIWAHIPNTNSWNQKLTMYIETPNGQIKASSVVQIKYTSALKWARELDSPDFRQTGEAAVADLGDGRYVFALLTETGTDLSMAAYPGYHKGDLDLTQWIGTLVKQTEERELPSKAYPMLVSFADISDPTSVYEVAPDDFEARFGEGYALKRMTLQVTDEAVTEGVEDLLLWLKNLEGGYLQGGITSKNAPLGLHGGNFKMDSFR
jgi:hypothetical protein